MSKTTKDLRTEAVCPLCGQTFSCHPSGACWCKELPPSYLPADLNTDECLCPTCLRKKAAEASAT